MLRSIFSGSLSLQGLIVTIISSLFVVFCTMPIHEAAHAFTAHKLGDNTAKYQGRLTLNPLAHIDYIGALLILLFGFGWAKPVPVNQWNFKHPKRDMALVAAAGPISNLLMGFILLIIANAINTAAGAYGMFTSGGIVYYSRGIETIATIFTYAVLFIEQAASINIYLAAFNLIPFPPLDGSRIFGAFLSDKLYYKIQSFEQYTYIILIVLTASGALSTVFGFIGSGLFSGVSYIADLPFKLFGANMPI